MASRDPKADHLSRSRQTLRAAIFGQTTVGSRPAQFGPNNFPRAAVTQPVEDVASTVKPNEMFPRTLRGIRRSPKRPYTYSVVTELINSLRDVSSHAKTIAEYIEQKSAFEHALIVGEIERASSVLATIESAFGQSTWLIEQKLVLADRTGGLEGLRTEAFTNYSATRNPWIGLITYHLMRRTEPTASAASYAGVIDELISFNLKAGTSYVKYSVNHLRLRFNYPEFRINTDPSAYLWRESQFSLIDSYESVIRAVQCLASTMSGTVELRTAATVIDTLRPVVNDRRLDALWAMVCNGNGTADDFDIGMLHAVGAYTRGDYRRSAQLSSELLKGAAGRLDAYELHAKSILNGQLTYENPFNEPSMAAGIHRRLYDVVSKADSTPEALAWMLKQAYVHDGQTIGPQLYAFVYQHSGKQTVASAAFTAVVASYITPRITSELNSGRAATVINAIDTVDPQNEAVALFRVRSDPHQLAQLDIPKHRRDKYVARHLEAERRVREAADLYRAMLADDEPHSTYKEDAATGLLRCYLALDDNEAAIIHVVEVYLRRRWLLISIDLGKILDSIKNGGSPPLSLIDWPLVHFIYNKESTAGRDWYSVFVAYDEFLTAQEVTRPSELLPRVAEFELKKMLFFLRDVCRREVMDNSFTAFESSAELDSERVRVCQALLKLSPSTAQETEREIVELLRGAVIRKAVREVGERRIYADVGGIKQSLGQPLREGFDRYVAHALITNERARRQFAVQGFTVNEAVQVVNLDAGDEAFAIFRSIFNEVKHLFLYSRELGLNFFLSVRIRHGWIRNHLRKIFDTERLITVSDRGVYQSNEYWLERLRFYGDQSLKELDRSLREFSAGVDDVIEQVRGRLIQIKAKTNDDRGLFDFDFADGELWAIHLHFRLARPADFDSFIDLIFSLLWSRTEQQLEKIREYVNGDLKATLSALLDGLESAISKCVGPDRGNVLSRSITSCRTGMQRELDVISSWFNIAERKDVPDFQPTLVVDTALDIVRKLHPARVIDDVVGTTPSETFRGDVFVPLVEMLLIMLDNVVEHGGDDPLRIYVRTAIEDGFFVLEVENPLKKGTDVQERKEFLANRRLEASQQGAILERSMAKEKGSGYFKLYGLARSPVLGGVGYEIDFSIRDDTTFVATVKIGMNGLRL